MIMEIVLLTAAGAGVGALVGRRKSCPDGGCPFTANPRRGALWGGVVGLLIAISAGQGIQAEPEAPMTDESLWRQATTAEAFQREVLGQPGVTVVYFHADWCGACRRFAPVLDRVARDTAKQARYVKVDVDAADALADEYEVTALPTTLIFRDGKVIARIVGGIEEEKMHEAVGKAASQRGGSGSTTGENSNVR